MFVVKGWNTLCGDKCLGCIDEFDTLDEAEYFAYTQEESGVFEFYTLENDD